MIEKWKNIPGFEGLYQVSDSGRIRSFYKRGHSLLNYLPKILNYPKPSKNQYLLVGLRKDKKTIMFRMHRLVLLAFQGYPPKGFECAHLNGKKNDNRLRNLRWVSNSENKEHNRIHGVMPIGEKSKKSKLKEAQVYEIKKLYKEGMSQKKIAEKFCISQQHVSGISNNQKWKHIKE